MIVRDERLDPGGETYAKRTLLWGKVNLFTAAMSWEIEWGGKKGFRKDFTHVQGK